MNPPGTNEWSKIKELGVLHTIKRPQDFARFLEEGMKRAQSAADGFNRESRCGHLIRKVFTTQTMHKIFLLIIHV